MFRMTTLNNLYVNRDDAKFGETINLNM